MWLAFVCVVLSADETTASPLTTRCCERPTAGKTDSIAISGSARVADSANFRVESRCAGCDARLVAKRCEQWRAHLQAKWLSDAVVSTWNPRCLVVIHGRRDSYSAAIGRGGEQSFGSSFVNSQGDRISDRRIDLLIDPKGTLSALGHELTHMVIADAFPGSQPPAWANEGAAVLADSTEKQQLHKRDLDRSVRHQAAFHCAELILMSEYPSPDRTAAFYGQSASLAAFLSQVGGPEKFVPFLKQARECGYDSALRKSYGIQGMAELQSRWNEHGEGTWLKVASANRPSSEFKSTP